ncbi:filamentous hemagglutinin family protein [Sphingomonas sp. H39-1-10]|uniref:filamentous haemagglutinin family protein n=1 Tax=Sphingomonas pollutisoli TaxID=3030829 RepID=UPI0023B8E90E|nr:filamentous haemagglutinin family protein [Sphingomonas pollutisoli]MDF0491401.1 filamentous hemagglutinin family protein [Sphingomonas pollutisoli]
MTADGTVVVINQAGIIFGSTSQVNTHSLLASTLELGNAARFVEGSFGPTQATTIKERNTAYLESGLFLAANGTTGLVDGTAVAPLLVSGVTTGDGKTFGETQEGSITIDSGARISGRAGGFVMLTAPEIDNAGTLTAIDGQVSLQAGRAIVYGESTGSDESLDPYVRGYKLNSYIFGASPTGSQAGGTVVNSGLISSTRGYISLGVGAEGSVSQGGLLETTTSVSRGGKISLTAGTVTLDGGVAMLADANGETIPLGTANDPADFKQSQLEIGTQVILSADAQVVGALTATDFTMGGNALIYAPGADVAIGANTINDPGRITAFAVAHPGHIEIASGALIDVAGLKDVKLNASRNSIEIDPVKRNELRDTPNYREVVVDDSFTLNGVTLYVDPRVSGVRSDGVAWVGSPLIEAASLAGQIPATAQEFMTKGGSVTLTTSNLTDFSNVSVDTAPSVHVASGATIDVSGGWVSYAAGTVKTSRLITADGRIVDIARADPNDIYVGVVSGTSEVLQPRLGLVQNYLSAQGQGQRYDAAYDEGRDAGALTISGAAVSVDGTIHGNAFAGSRQIASGERPSAASTLTGDLRLVQASSYELPSGAALTISSLGDVLVYHGNRGSTESDWSELLLSDAMLNDAGLSQLSLTAAGKVTFAGLNPDTLQSADALRITGVSDLTLALGGILSVEAGRTIRFDGNVTIASGTIEATSLLNGATLNGLSSAVSNGSAFRTGLYGDGSGDDIASTYLYAEDPGDLRAFDVIVGGTLSTAGGWVNDYREPGQLQGGAFSDGGSISLTVAPNVFVAIGDDLKTATQAADLSGSIRVSGGLDVSAGGYVTSTGSLVLDGKGGDVSLVNNTVYASTRLTDSGVLTSTGTSSDRPVGGGPNQSVEFTPVPGGPWTAVLPSLVPDEQRATVDITGATITGYGFTGGGTFSLVAPNVSFGSDNPAGSTHIGLDVFKTTGFGTLDVSTYRSRIVDDLFANDRVSKSAFLETTRFTVGSGETLDLTQWMLPTILSTTQARSLLALDTGADLLSQSFLAPTTNDALWDRKAAHLVLGGLTELDVLEGGSIIGAPEASLTVTKLTNAGSIVLHGGTIGQHDDLVSGLLTAGLGVDDLAEAFGGSTDEQGRFLESADNAAGLTDPAEASRLLTNAELVSKTGADRLVYFLGLAGQDEGIVLSAGSTTDLSGIAVTNPRALRQASGVQIRTGRVIDGGTISLGAPTQINRQTGASQQTTILTGSTLVRDDAATVDISGASATFDQATRLGGYAAYAEWSKAGTISALAGGSLGTTAIDAHGGVAQAEGGTLEWLRPTVGTATDGGADYLDAGMIEASGFDTLIARRSLTLDGDVDLKLRKALMVTSQDPLVANFPYDTGNAGISIAATAGSNATVTAGYVRLASRIGTGSPGQAGNLEDNASVRLQAGSQGIDLIGAVPIDRSIGDITFATPGDVRLTGVTSNFVDGLPTLDGMVVTTGNLTIDAGRTYTTTGTGNLQIALENPNSNTTPYYIAAIGDRTITFGNSYLDPRAATPLSAGSRLSVLAQTIVQNGYLAAPLGVLQLGDTGSVRVGGPFSTPTETLTFGAGSVTSVSGAGLTIPYGTTTDGIEYYFPTVGTPLTQLPVGELVLSAGSIVQAEGSLIDGRGGGDVYAYEFRSGATGSRDVLDRFNRDAFSSNNYDLATRTGYQYADERQVYALVPVSEAGGIAAFDPIYSADYGSAGPVDLYGASAGKTVVLDAAPGIAGGEYLLVPAKYAMAIPGALRLVENTDAGAPVVGTSTTLLDGSVVVGGTYAYADTGIAESTRHSFTVQTKEVFTKYSSITTTSGSDYLEGVADKAGTGRPRLPLDAARVVLAPLTELKLAGAFDLSAGEGGQAGQVDLLGSNILIASADTEAADGVLLISDATLAKLNGPSLLIGGRRSDNADGTTTITASATNITVAGGARLEAAELLLAVGGAGSALSIEDGATLTATGTLGAGQDSDYVTSGAGSLLRLANGGERLVTRTGTGESTLAIGAATLDGEALALDSSGSFIVSDDASIAAKTAAISGADLRFDDEAAVAGEAGAIGAGLEAKLAAAERLTVRSPGMIRFSGGTHHFNDLVLDTASLATDIRAAVGSSVTLQAGNVRLLNSTDAADGCTAASCGAGSSFTLDARTISLGSNDVRASGFAEGVTLAASDGLYVEGKGSFSAGDAVLALNTPFIAERSAAADPRAQTVRPDYAFLTSGAVTVSADGTNGAATIEGDAAPGANLAFGTIDDRVASFSVTGTTIRATAGIIDVQSQGDIALNGAALSVPGYEKTFGDEVDPVIVSAGGGTINLFSANGGISTDAASTLVTDTGTGKAGTLNLLASNGAILLDAALNPGVTLADDAAPRQGSFAFDSGTSAFDLAGFVADYGRLFAGDVAIRSGASDLALDAGQTIKARSVTLTADGGGIAIAGTIDTSGVDVTGMTADAARDAAVNGGDIQLWGRSGVTLAATALLDTHTTGYADTDSRVASAGNVTIGIDSANGAIAIENGATIDVGARRTQADPGVGRLVAQTITDPATGSPVTVYRYAEADQGGTVTFRAPVIGTDRNKVALSQRGSILGADSVQLEAFQRYDLDQLADSGFYTGITRGEDGAISLDFGAAGANPLTTDMALADGTSSLVRFIQGFDVSTVDGSSLDGVRLRPGVELVSTGDIATATQWNLAAASFSTEQLDAALAAGVLELIPEISTAEAPRYKVVPGKEGALLDRYATFLYRVDGSARGEAPVVTLRAGGDLTVNRTISDGFFTFRDKSDPAYVSYQLGGGDRTWQPALNFTCGSTSSDCNYLPSYGDGSNPGTSNTLVIALGTAAVQGDLADGASKTINSPLSLTGNSAAGGGEGQDSLGFGELFPLLGGDTAMHSSDLRLVAGTGSRLSVNPLAVDRALAADVVVQGEYSYALTATGTVAYDGGLQFHLARSTTDPTNINFDIGDTLDLTERTAGLDQLKDDTYTQLNWGSSAGLGADARAAARTFFAGKGYSFVGNATNPTGIVAPLNEVLAFLQSFEPTWQAGLASGRTGYSANRNAPIIRYGTAAQQTSPTAPNRSYVKTVIRSGDGDIAVAAARDIDLRGGAEAVYRRPDGTVAAEANYALATNFSAQYASSAIYTVGVRVAPSPLMARIADTGELVTLSPDSPYLEAVAAAADFIPSPKGISGNQPVLAHGGGDIILDAGRDVLGRRDAWTQLTGTVGQGYNGASSNTSTGAELTAGQQTQAWRVGTIGVDTEIGLSADYFTSGVGALAGGDVTIDAGRDVSELTVALGATVTTNESDAGNVMLTFGSGDLALTTGRDILAGQIDIASGAANIIAGRDIATYGYEPIAIETPQYLRVRLADAVVDVSANGSARIASVSALGVDQRQQSAGFYAPTASFTLEANDTAAILGTTGLGGVRESGQQPSYMTANSSEVAFSQILPPSLQITSLSASVELPVNMPQILYPSAIGQLRLYSAGDLTGLVIGMSDVDPGRLGGAFAEQLQYYQLPGVTTATTATELRNQHSQLLTHLGDDEPIRIYTLGSIDNAVIFAAKQARVSAGGDIVDLFFQGQNLTATDISRVWAGGDISGTIAKGFDNLPYVRSNNFILGGPGTLMVEAGGDLGPFVTSATIGGASSGGGIRTVGNDYNPWLPGEGANVSVRFGMAGGADYTALRDTYLDPANAAMLDGDLFAQVTDSFGNQKPDRTKPIYAPRLASWLREHYPDLFAQVFGSDSFADDTALASAAYGKTAELYAALTSLDLLHQQDFLVNQLYFNELASVTDQDGPSYQQYIRGYRAVQALFPTGRGYTDNLAAYTTDLATVSEDHPLGEPVRNVVNGQPQVADRVHTGDVDLRLATIQTARGGDVGILGPGGDVIAGSVVRTSEQASRRTTALVPQDRVTPLHYLLQGGSLTPSLGVNTFDSVPLGYEGVLTLTGGAISSFTDGSVILNQSRVFSQQSGNITMWSSNGDIAAGQGPKSASNFPPVTVRFDENGLAEVDSAGSVSGAGIGSFQRTPEDPPSDVLLIAPVGTVDAGDAGVRASGNVVVAAARVANADNFKAAGDITGVPSSTTTNVVATPADAASAIAAQAAAAANSNDQRDRRSIITVDVLGPASDGRCDPNSNGDPDCR